MNLDGSAHRIDHARKHGEASIAQVLKQITTVRGDSRLQHLPVASSHDPGRFLVPLHQCCVAHHIGEHHREQATLLRVRHVSRPPSPDARSMAERPSRAAFGRVMASDIERRSSVSEDQTGVNIRERAGRRKQNLRRPRTDRSCIG